MELLCQLSYLCTYNACFQSLEIALAMVDRLLNGTSINGWSIVEVEDDCS